MKKLMLALATTTLFATTSFSSAQVVYEDTYNLTITGSVSAAPCKVTTTGSDKQGNLHFDRLYPQDFSGAGSEATAKSQTLKVRLVDCALTTSGGTALTTADVVVNGDGGATGSRTNWDVGVTGVGMKLEILGNKVSNPGVIDASNPKNEFSIAIENGKDTEFTLKGTIVQIENELTEGHFDRSIPLHVIYN